MLYIRNLLSPRSRATQEAQVDHLLEKVGVTGDSPLKDTSGTLLLKSIQSSAVPQKFIKTLIAKLTSLSSPEEIAKMLTLIHTAVSEQQYQGTVLEQLEGIGLLKEEGCRDMGEKGKNGSSQYVHFFNGNVKEEIVHRDRKAREGAFKEEREEAVRGVEDNLRQGRELKKQSYFWQFQRAYVSYLIKLPSAGQVYARALKNQSCWRTQLLLVDLFRLVNQLKLLLPSVVVFFNTIGRYYLQKKKIYRSLYCQLHCELSMCYDYLKNIIDRLFLPEVYTEQPKEQLEILLASIAEIQIMVDQIEEFLMNKYFHGKKPIFKIYFRAHHISELQYHLLTHFSNHRNPTSHNPIHNTIQHHEPHTTTEQTHILKP